MQGLLTQPLENQQCVGFQPTFRSDPVHLRPQHSKPQPERPQHSKPQPERPQHSKPQPERPQHSRPQPLTPQQQKHWRSTGFIIILLVAAASSVDCLSALPAASCPSSRRPSQGSTRMSVFTC
uniref:Uncharacterized protein n=1 Tax=Stegastes partitus TaxID=144197 RepID=A0A3B5ALW0_9TELE